MIISIIESIVGSLSAGSTTFAFGHGPEYFANLDLDEATFPVVYLDQPIDNDYQLAEGGYIGEEYPVTLFFMYKSQLAWTPAEHESNCIEPANDAIRNFLASCQASPDIDEVSDATALEFINLLDVNVSGKSLTVTIKPRINKSVCVNAVPIVCKPATEVIKDSAGTVLYNKLIASGASDETTITDSVVSNSNDSYSEDVLSQQNLALPNIDFTDSDGITTPVPSMEDIIATPATPQTGIAYQRPQATGQTTSYITGDDGWQVNNNPYSNAPVFPVSFAVLVAGSFTTLVSNNAFGNKNRFTDSVGGQIYGSGNSSLTDYIIDHLTGLAWSNSGVLNVNFTDSINNANSLTLHSFTDWKVPNLNEIISVQDVAVIGASKMNYLPFSRTTTQLRCSTTWSDDTTQTLFITTFMRILFETKSNNRQTFNCRNHY